MPIHWGTFPILAGTPGQLQDEFLARSLGEVLVHDIRPGQTIGR